MPYLPTSDQWLHQSHLLLEARPSTTRVTTKYTIHRPSDAADAAATPAPQKHQKSKALLTLRTYDPVSGVCLKYKTTRAWEVGRLVGALGGLGRRMGGAREPEKAEEMEVDDDLPATGPAGEKGGGTAAEGGQGKKKKKGKR